MLKALGYVWWRIRCAVWRLRWRHEFWLGLRREMHGLKVGVQRSFSEEVERRAMRKVEAALDLIAEHEPRRMRRIARDFHRIWIQPAGYAPAYFIGALKLCVLDRKYITADDTEPALIAVAIVHEAAHARLESRAIPYSESARPRIEAFCDAQSAVFARRLPNGEALAQRILHGGPQDATYWNDENLDRRLAGAVRIEADALLQELEDAEVPGWVKRMVQKVIKWRAA